MRNGRWWLLNLEAIEIRYLHTGTLLCLLSDLLSVTGNTILTDFFSRHTSPRCRLDRRRTVLQP